MFVHILELGKKKSNQKIGRNSATGIKEKHLFGPRVLRNCQLSKNWGALQKTVGGYDAKHCEQMHFAA